MTEIENVPGPREMPRQRREAMARLLTHEVEHSRHWWQLPFLRRLAHRGRGPFTVGVGALALVLAGGGASAYVMFRPVEDDRTVRCFAEADLEAEELAPEVSLIGPEQEGGGEQLPIDDPVAQCAELWRHGLLPSEDTDTSQDPAPTSDEQSVPGLVACTLDEGIAGVFPGDESTCEQLGLPRTTR